MANLTITNVDVGNVIQKNAQFRDELLIFGGAGTVLEGTILARQEVNNAPVASAVTGTGNGTVTSPAAVAPGPIVPLVGVYTLTVVETIVEGGVMELTDPNGAIVGSNLILDPAGEASTEFEVAGLLFTVNEGSTDFIAGDFFTITVVADGKMIPFAIAGAGGAQIPIAIITFDSVATGAGNEAIRAGVAGSYRKERLIIDADGDGSNITDAILDQLRDFGLVPIDVQELNKLDNQ